MYINIPPFSSGVCGKASRTALLGGAKDHLAGYSHFTAGQISFASAVTTAPCSLCFLCEPTATILDMTGVSETWNQAPERRLSGWLGAAP